MEQRASFLVRVWVQEDGEEGSICGEVVHVRTGQRRSFRSEGELLHILRTWLLGQNTAFSEEEVSR